MPFLIIIRNFRLTIIFNYNPKFSLFSKINTTRIFIHFFFHYHRKPTVGVLSTGNELQSPEKKLLPGQIRDSNKIMLIKLLESKGFPVIDCGIAIDELVSSFTVKLLGNIRILPLTFKVTGSLF